MRPFLAAPLVALLALALPAPDPVPPDVVAGHPRIFIRADDIPKLKERVLSESDASDAYRRVRELARGAGAPPDVRETPDALISILTAYVLEDRDPALLERARQYVELLIALEGDPSTRARVLRALALAYDWLHGDLSAGERARLAARMTALVEALRGAPERDPGRGAILYAGLALAGDGVADDAAAAAIAEGEARLRAELVAARGSDDYRRVFAGELPQRLEAWRTATGEDLFASATAARGAATWLFHVRPDDGTGAGAAACLPLLAARYRDGVARLLTSELPADRSAALWPRVLWLDPSVASPSPREIPTDALFAGIGWASMRGSWSDDAVRALFVCGDRSAARPSAHNRFSISRGTGAGRTSLRNRLLVGDGGRAEAGDAAIAAGEIVSYEEHPLFTHVAGRTPAGVRRFIFLKPSTFVVDDLVRAPARGATVRWLLSSSGEPEIAGRRVRVAGGGGELLCETLLPREADPRVASARRGEGSRSFHRVVITAGDSAGDVRFLHVIATGGGVGSDSDGAARRCELVERDGVAKLAVRDGQRVFRLTLTPDPLAGSEIAIDAADGSVLLPRRLLPSGVLPHGPDGRALLARWDSRYREAESAPWDTGRPSSNLRRAVEEAGIRPGRAVVLGCGAGTNAVHLAALGFEVTGVDIAPTALSLARARADAAGVSVRWLLADVLDLPEAGPFDFIFDRGCYHGVRRGNAAGYVESLRRVSRPGTRVLILAGNANEPPPHRGPPRVTEEELRGDFSALFDFEWLRETRFDAATPQEQGALAWSALLRRKGAR